MEIKENSPEQKKVEDYSTIELKALVYDALATIEQNQTNIKIINEELKKRG